MTYLSTRKHPLPLLAGTALGLAISPLAIAAQEVPSDVRDAPANETAAPSAPAPATRAPANLIRTFAPIGLLAEHNSNENFAGFQSRLGTLVSHQSAATATGVTTGYRDTIDSVALPLKVTLALTDDEDFYLKLGFAPAWTDSHGGNLTESDSSTLSGQVSINYRPDPDLVVGIGVVAGRTELDFRHNGGEATSDFVGVQLDYMQRMSDSFGIAARAIWSDGSNDTAIPLGTSGRTLSYTQDNSRLYLEASALMDLPAQSLSFLPAGVKMRPIATFMYQRTDYSQTTDSLGHLRPSYDEELGIARLALRFEKEERRQWRLVPYMVAGLEREFVNTVSDVDDDPANTYLKAGLGMNVGGHGRVDLFYVRRDSFHGTYNANQVTVFASLLF